MPVFGYQHWLTDSRGTLYVNSAMAKSTVLKILFAKTF